MTRTARAAKLGVAATLLLAALSAGGVVAQDTAAATEPAERGVLARVNGEALYAADVASLLANIHRGASPTSRASFDSRELIFRLVNDSLLAQEARALGMAEEEPIPTRKADLRERLATSRLWQEEIGASLAVEADQIEAAYRRSFRSATLRILTRRSLEEAEALKARAAAGEDLEALVRAESQDPYRGRGGLMDDVAYMDIPRPLAEAAFATPVGELGGPVATSLGWSVFRVIELKEADPEGLAKRRGAARRLALWQQERELRAALAARLRQRHPVEVRQEVLDSIDAQRMPEGRLVPQVASPQAVVATVGGRSILARELGNRLTSDWANIALPEVALSQRSAVLEELIFDELVAGEGLRRGYGSLPEVDREVEALERKLLVERYLTEVLGGETEISPEETKAYYVEHREQFRRPPKLHLSQITTATEAEARKVAELARSGADFAWLARQHSTDRFRDAGGSRGSMPASQALEEFQRELAGAATGDVFGPKGAADNWRVIKVDLVEDQGIYDFEQVSGNVRARLADGKFMQRVDSLIRQLRERAEIWVDEEAVAALDVGRKPKEAPAKAPGHGGA